MPLYYLVISTPFFCSGLALALLFTRGSRSVNRLYAFDLIGAGLGCAAIALVMPAFGGSGSVVVAAALGLLSAVVFGFRETRGLALAAAALCAIVFASAFFAERLLPISITPNKLLNIQKPIYTAWNTFSRIDVYERQPNVETKAPGTRRFIFDAGTAGTGLNDLRPDVRAYLSRRTDDAGYTSGIAYVGKQRPKILIIGSGGGQQVLDALHFGARDITAVEINPIINEVVTSRMRDYWGNLFNQPEVHLVTEEGRSYVRRFARTVRCDHLRPHNQQRRHSFGGALVGRKLRADARGVRGLLGPSHARRRALFHSPRSANPASLRHRPRGLRRARNL